jgi:hypothetical protein
MACKLLEKCKEAEREIFDEARGNKLELEYYLLISETDDYEDAGLQKTYGVEVVKKINDLFLDSKVFQNVFLDRERVKDIIRTLANNAVTPVTLPYILDDLLGM